MQSLHYRSGCGSILDSVAGKMEPVGLLHEGKYYLLNCFERRHCEGDSTELMEYHPISEL